MFRKKLRDPEKKDSQPLDESSPVEDLSDEEADALTNSPKSEESRKKTYKSEEKERLGIMVERMARIAATGIL